MRLLRIMAALALLIGSLASAVPVAAGGGCHDAASLPARSEGDEPQVKMMPCAFAPTVVRVEPGTTVTWFNADAIHLLTGANREWGSADVEVRSGETIAYRFDRPGTYPYACAIHSGMAGTIVVGDGVAVATAGAGPAVAAVTSTGASPVPSSAPAAVVPAGSARPAAAAVAVATEPATAIANVQLAALLAIAGVVVLLLALARQAARSRRRAIRT